MSSPSPQRDTSSVAAKANYAPLVDFHRDLSLFCCEPSIEFRPIGSALTTKRKEEAETGTTHKTACRLAFLFNDIIPNTPALRKAYGKRTSEIISKPETNPQGTDDDGPFQDFIGADCTSIWAAATSGDAAISMVLLACMLADAFDAKKAVSIWSELVDHRKRSILSLLEGRNLVNPNNIVAAQQDITRAELGTWDASARSWLRRADLAMKHQKKKFTQIIDKIAVPYPGGASVFERVTTTWIRGMEVLENLLNNKPQQTRDRAILAGIAAWHLYPDLLVFQTEAKSIAFHDDLIPDSGILTLGLEYNEPPSDDFVSWSLALSHLRYYGDPVLVKSNDTVKRIDMSDMWPIALGTLLYHWEVPYTGIKPAMAWFEELGHTLRRGPSRHHAAFSWLLRLCDSVTNLDDKQHESTEILVKYGRRRGTRFLGEKSRSIPQIPFWGLYNQDVISALKEKNEADAYFRWLRKTSGQIFTDVRDAVASYKGIVEGHRYTEWATIKRLELDDGATKYSRWIYCSLWSTSSPAQDASRLRAQATLERRADSIQEQGEICYLILHFGSRSWLEESYDLDSPPPFFKNGDIHFFVDCFRESKHHELLVDGSSGQASRWEAQVHKALKKDNCAQKALLWLTTEDRSDQVATYLLSYFCNHEFVEMSPGRKRKRSPTESPESSPEGGLIYCTDLTIAMAGKVSRSSGLIIALRALEVASDLYTGLPGANISLGMVEQNLLKALWLPSSLKRILGDLDKSKESHTVAMGDVSSLSIDAFIMDMKREQMFACVAMFESGRFNLDPTLLTAVVALCYENSIFISQILLSDPTDQSSQNKLTHRVGNVGHTGMVFMVSPREPRVRPVRHDPFSVNHRQFDYTSADMFKATSLHLSFTTWKVPIDWEYTGEIDQEVFLLESVVSVQDNGVWVADIDVIGSMHGHSHPRIVDTTCSYPFSHELPEIDAVALDAWEELLDSPPCMGVFRGQGNWVARLAATCILVQQGRDADTIIVTGDETCWQCLLEKCSGCLPEIIIH